MKFNKVFVLITLVILRTANKVQGQVNLNQRQHNENADFHSLAPPELLHDFIWERYLERHSSSVFDSEKILKHLSNFKDFHQEQNPNEHHFKTAKSHDLELANTFSDSQNNKEQHNSEKIRNVNTAFYKSISPQRVYCRQIMKSELNTQGEIFDSVQNICDPLPSVTTPYTTIRERARPTTTVSSFLDILNAPKEKRFGRLVSTTPAGINCRRVMNSELNEQGEIVDSVTEVCDPPTTTTTTTQKPRLSTTARTTTTTPKPLVKVCRPVMNSYLSEEGKIIDSVTMVCNMETWV